MKRGRKLLYIYYLITTLFCGMFFSCVNTLEVAHDVIDERLLTQYIHIDKAYEYYEQHIMSGSRSSEVYPTHDAPYVVGNLLPDWESVMFVVNECKFYADFAMRKDYCFYRIFNKGEGQTEYIELYSRFVSVEEFAINTISQYIATYIPDYSYVSKYEERIFSDGYCCENMGDFTGVVLYTLPAGFHIAAYEYIDGAITNRSFLYDKEKTVEQNQLDFLTVMDGVIVGIGANVNDTRGNPITILIEEIIIYGDKQDVVLPVYVAPPVEEYELVEPILSKREGEGGGGSNNSSEEESDEDESLADELFDTSYLSKDEKNTLEKMLSAVINDCMGGELYNSLVNYYSLDEAVLSIEFNDVGRSTFGHIKNEMQSHVISLCGTDVSVLVHEMIHAYQLLMCGGMWEVFNLSKANYEVTAQIGRYLFGKRNGGELEKEWSEWFGNPNKLGYVIAQLSKNISKNGTVSPRNESAFERLYSKIGTEYQKHDSTYVYNPQLNTKQNLSSITEISRNCK